MTASGKVYLIGAGPGDPDLLTMKAARLLGEADVILHDDLVSQPVLNLARNQALILNVGKRCGAKSITQEQIHQLMIEHAQSHRTIARLKSGDPLIFGRAAEEIEALTAAAVPFEIVPGITAASAAAAAIAVSLTDRRVASAVLLTSGHHASGGALDAPSPHDQTRVVYMPGRDLAALAAAWQAEGLDAETPCAVISQATQPQQQILRVSLAALATVSPGPPPVIIIAGAVLMRAL